MAGSKGFTLVELMATIFLLSILLLIAAPNIIMISQKWILETTAREMVEDIRWTQHLAIVEGQSYNFEIHLSEKYYLIRPARSKEVHRKKVKLNPNIVRVTSTLANNGQFFDYKVLTYSETGNPSQTGRIVLESRDGNSVTITIAVGSGRAKIIR